MLSSSSGTPNSGVGPILSGPAMTAAAAVAAAAAAATAAAAAAAAAAATAVAVSAAAAAAVAAVAVVAAAAAATAAAGGGGGGSRRAAGHRLVRSACVRLLIARKVGYRHSPARRHLQVALRAQSVHRAAPREDTHNRVSASSLGQRTRSGAYRERIAESCWRLPRDLQLRRACRPEAHSRSWLHRSPFPFGRQLPCSAEISSCFPRCRHDRSVAGTYAPPVRAASSQCLVRCRPSCRRWTSIGRSARRLRGSCNRPRSRRTLLVGRHTTSATRTDANVRAHTCDGNSHSRSVDGGAAHPTRGCRRDGSTNTDPVKSCPRSKSVWGRKV